MIDVLGFHDDRDYSAELARIQAEIRALTSKVSDSRFHSWEDRHNSYGRLGNLHRQERVLLRESAMENQRLNRLADAVRLAGDAELGFIAYVVFGPDALPVAPLYEVRLIDEYGYTVPSCIRTNLPADRVARVKQQLLKVDGPAYARERALRFVGYRIQVTPF